MQEPTSNVQNGLLSCTLDKTVRSLFFSLVDYRNSLFMSNDPKKITEFYDGFENRDQLIEWMKERPKGASYIHEVEGDKDIIVVIPTVDFNGKYARECRENIFKGLHIIFVESGTGNYYFNYDHNCNVGIMKAMEYNPKWVVVSNDDMYKIDSLQSLKDIILTVNPEDVDALFAAQKDYITTISQLSERRILFKLLIGITIRKLNWNNLERKFKIKLKGAPLKGFYALLYKKGINFLNFVSFVILSYEFIRKRQGCAFDETYINGAEDTDLSLELHFNNRVSLIQYKIGALRGSTLGMNEIRRYKEIPSNAYLNYKLERKELQISGLNT